jgi:protein TonB
MEFQKPVKKLRLFGLLAMVIGAFLMMLLVVAMNKKAPEKKKGVKTDMRYVQMKKTKTQPKAKPKPKRRSKRTKKAPPKAPLPDLGAALSGLEMNIPELETDAMLGDADKLLGDLDKDAVMSENSVDVKPRVVSRTQMIYPQSALRKKIKGYVVVNLLIDEEGSVEIAKVIDSTPPGVFDRAALDGVRQWRFSPAQYKGRAVKIWAKQKIRFDFE